MKLLDLISIYIPNFNPRDSKVHLAVHNGIDDPLDVFLADKFKEWQEEQSKKNFERKYIISLINIPNTEKWLLGGIYESLGCEFNSEKQYFKYHTQIVDEVKELVGRLVIKYKRKGRQSYRCFETIVEDCMVDELKAKPLTISDFPGYNNTCISKLTLDIIINSQLESWKSALSNISGVYLITDKNNGKLYVGSAYGKEGIWQRWSEYSSNNHGGNKELIALLNEKGKDYFNNFQYSILEIVDSYTTHEYIIQREQYWKNVLYSKEHGYNSN